MRSTFQTVDRFSTTWVWARAVENDTCHGGSQCQSFSIGTRYYAYLLTVIDDISVLSAVSIPTDHKILLGTRVITYQENRV